ncbi:MAG: hypothetical protein ACQRW7_11390 [Caulobacterales bacterium]|uniref:hypothetical protein n=1 Tax=Glycocaulis sp. TaxID=1969725 RepID=UPI003F9FE16F
MRTLAEIDADIAAFQAARRKALLGEAVSSMKHGDREIRFEGGMEKRVQMIDAELLKLRHERSQLTGERSPMAAYHPRGMGAR